MIVAELHQPGFDLDKQYYIFETQHEKRIIDEWIFNKLKRFLNVMFTTDFKQRSIILDCVKGLNSSNLFIVIKRGLPNFLSAP